MGHFLNMGGMRVVAHVGSVKMGEGKSVGVAKGEGESHRGRFFMMPGSLSFSFLISDYCFMTT